MQECRRMLATQSSSISFYLPLPSSTFFYLLIKTRQLLKALKLPLQGEGGERGSSSTYQLTNLTTCSLNQTTCSLNQSTCLLVNLSTCQLVNFNPYPSFVFSLSLSCPSLRSTIYTYSPPPQQYIRGHALCPSTVPE